MTYRFAVKRLPVAFLLFIVLGAGDARAQSSVFDSIYDRSQSELSAYFPRTEGSQAERQTAAYIRSVLDEFRVANRSYDFNGLSDGHSFSLSIEAYIPGATPDELILAIPLNDRDDASPPEAGAARIAFGVAVAAAFSRMALPVSVRVLFLGAEYGTGSAYPMGSRQFLDRFFPDYPVVVLYIDLAYTPERLVVRAGDSGHVSPYWLVGSVSDAMDSASLFYLVLGNETQFYRLGLSVNPAPLEPYLGRGYPGISLHSSGNLVEGEAGRRWATKFYEFLLGFIIENDRGFEEQWDRHYLFFQARSFSTIIPERSYILIIIAALATMVLYPLLAPNRFRSYMHSIVKYLWAIPALIGLVFGLLFLGTLIVEGVTRIQGFPDVWQLRPALFFALKLSAAVFLFAILFRYVKRIPFPKRGRFYSALALMLLYADIIVLSTLDISLAYYAVWACMWAFLFSLSSSRTAKTACLLASMIWFVKAGYDVFTLPELSVARVLLLSRTSGNLMLALLLLPFLAMLIRLDFMFRHPRRRTKRILMTTVYPVLGVAFGVLLVYLSIFTPYSPARPQPVSVFEEADLTAGSATITIESPAPLRGLDLVVDKESYVVDTAARVYSRRIEPIGPIVSIEPTAEAFLGRKRVRIEIGAVGAPRSVSVRIRSYDDLVVYDANFPFSYESFAAAIIHIGRNPPLPLAVEFTIPAEQSGTLSVGIEYDDPPTHVSVSGPALSLKRRLRITRTFDLIRDL